MMPVEIISSVIQGLLSLDPALRDIVAWRYQGLPYKEIAQRQGTSTQLAEMRHKRALRDWPALQALFPEKVAKQSRRKRK
jgi:DNA-directed RNA polymerase specialized sigma24 family protein